MTNELTQQRDFVDEAVDRLCRVYYRHSRREDRMDIASEVLLAAHRRSEAAPADDVDAFRGWLHQIARNVVRNWSRRAGVASRVVGAETEAEAATGGNASSAPGADEALIRDEAAAALWAAVQELPEGHRQVVWLFYVDESPVSEIAQRLGLRAGTVKSRLHHARPAGVATAPRQMTKHSTGGRRRHAVAAEAKR
jgi:RNA polymerase sigma factor (sigma-70 family)